MQNRRRFLSHLAAVTAVSATTTAAAATSMLSTLTGSASDPIFAAIAAHREAAATFLAVLGVLSADADPYPDMRPLGAAIRARYAATNALIEMAPTTSAGLRALQAHLRDDRYSSDRPFIGLPVIFDDGRLCTIECRYPEAVDWFIARRASEMTGGLPPRALHVDELISAIRRDRAAAV
jgi:hypothetical protein